MAELARSSVKTLDDYVKDRLRLHGPTRSEERHGAFGPLLLDLPQLRTRLYAANKDMYGDYDRLAAEADLKVNVGQLVIKAIAEQPGATGLRGLDVTRWTRDTAAARRGMMGSARAAAPPLGLLQPRRPGVPPHHPNAGHDLTWPRTTP